MSLKKIAILGALISVTIALIQGGLTFWRTSVIISAYGVEVNAISQVALQVFSYLILFESGLGAAYLYKMYEPYSNKEYKKVNALYLGLSRSLRKISVKMFIAVVVLAFVYPFILSENSINYFSAFFIIILLGIRFVFPFFFTLSKKSIFAINQKQYLVVLIDGIINCVIIIIEIYLAKIIGIRIEYVLLVGIFFSIVSNYIYSEILKKKFYNITGYSVRLSSDGDQMTKDIMVHQIASLANTRIDSILLSFVDLFSVTIYTAYDAVMTYPITLVNKVVDTIRASIGLKLVDSVESTYSTFKEIMSINYFVASITTATFIIAVNDFITLWIGNQFLLNDYCVILFAAILFRRLIINSIYLVRDGQGLYKESKNYTVITALVNIVFSVIVLNNFGILGLLIVTVLSTYLIMDLGNYYLVYCVVFKRKLVIYLDLLLVFSSIILSVLLSNSVIKLLVTNPSPTWSSFIISSLITTIISLIVTTILLALFNKSFVSVILKLRKSILN